MSATGLILNDEQKGTVSLAVQAGAVALAERMQLVEHVISQMQEGVHFGASFPGDKKKNLLKAGADYLGVAFRLVPTFEVERIDLAGGHREYSVNCRVEGSQGQLITNGLGSCTTMESKYRWRNANKKCPQCGAEAIIKGKAEYGGGWLCFERKGGCKAKFTDTDPDIVEQVTGKVENADPADQFNTCLKIAKKRAMVDAMITATGCSAEFTQDVEDMQREEAPTPRPAPQQQKEQPVPVPVAQSANIDVEALLANIDEATDFTSFKKAVDVVKANAAKIPSPDMARFMTLKRNGEIKWGAL